MPRGLGRSCLLGAFLCVLGAFPAWGCDLYPTHHGEPLYTHQMGETGLTVFGWDLTGDGKADIETVWQKGADGEYLKWPIFYGFNLAAQGEPRLILKDTGGLGKCADIKLHWKLDTHEGERQIGQ